MGKVPPENDSTAYCPVNCEFHDVLESVATLRKSVAIEIRSAAGVKSTRTARIVDIYSEGGGEFITLDSGETIRLDAVDVVDGVRATQFD